MVITVAVSTLGAAVVATGFGVVVVCLPTPRATPPVVAVDACVVVVWPRPFDASSLTSRSALLPTLLFELHATRDSNSTVTTASAAPRRRRIGTGVFVTINPTFLI